jgi:N-methylhydantoinase A
MRVATDIGGTFTDMVTLDRRGIHGWKVLSTPTTPDRAVTDTVRALKDVSSFSHGTTVATNALLERKGARIALVTTKGFKDLLHIARQRRPRLYDFDCARPDPLVPRRLCYEVEERLAPDGSILLPLSEAAACAVAERIAADGAEAVAICLLFSYKNPAHEILLEKALREKGLSTSRSSEIIPEFREFERASTIAVNAYVSPVVRSYLERIRKMMRNSHELSDYYVMKSGGGVAASSEVYPVEMLLSGPAGGVAGGVLLGRIMQKPNLVTFDMGGTSADFSAIVDYAPLWTDEGEIDGLPVRIPILDITTVGAGGGSIAWTDSGGALRVGPQSAGSDPGPASYGRGGASATVTDADLLSGLVDERSLADTGIAMDPGRAREVLGRLAATSGLSMEEVVPGVRSVVHANMLRGIRRATVEKGIDVRDCSLLAFGGAGPLHGAELARALGMGEVLVPPMAGMFSALGILLSDVRLDLGRSLLVPWRSRTKQTVDRMLGRFQDKALASMARHGVSNRAIHFRPALDLRYQGQSFHLSIPYSNESDMVKKFHRAFRKRYGYGLEGHGVEVVAVRLSAVAPREKVLWPSLGKEEASPAAERKVLLASGWRSVPVFQRKKLGRSFHAPGPAVIEDKGCTVFVPPDAEVSTETNGCLRIRLG